MLTCRSFAFMLVAFLLATNFAAANDLAKLVQTAPDWTRAVREDIRAFEHHFTASDACSFATPNRAEHLRTHVMAGGIEVTPRTEGEEWRVKLTLLRYGRDGALTDVEPPTLSASGNRSELERGKAGLSYISTDRDRAQVALGEIAVDVQALRTRCNAAGFFVDRELD